MTFEQFLAVVDEDDYAEWVDSTVILKETESAAHQDLLGLLGCLLKWHTEDHDAGEVLCSPFLMKRTDFFVLDGEGRYQRATPEANGRYASAVLPGFWVSVGWLWQSPLPPVRQVLGEWWEAVSSH